MDKQEQRQKTSGIKLKLFLGALVAGIILITLIWNSLWGNVDFREYHVKQLHYWGTMDVIDEPGIYFKFGKVKTYKRAHMFYFSEERLDGGMGEESKPLNATFMGNSTAEVSGICKYILPSGDSLRLKVHRTYGSDKAVKMELVRNAIAGALKQTGPMFRPEEAFITRRDEFTTLVLDQLEQGLFETETETQEREEIEDEFIDETTGKSHKKVKIIREQVTKLRYKDGKPIIKRISALKTHGIIITDLVIKNFNFDTLTTTNIQLKKRAEQEQVVAKAKSETAKQNAIKEKHEGDARIAKARADEEVEKITAVTQAEKARDVMTLKAEEAEQFALKIKREGEARAYAAKKLVDAGLTPLKRAEIERDTKIGMAEAWAKRPVPTFIAGGSSNGQTDPLAPLGFKAMVDLVNGLD